MGLERTAGTARHRGVRPVFLLLLALALAIAVLVVTRSQAEQPVERAVAPEARAADWLSLHKAQCNAVEVTTLLASSDPGIGVVGRAQRAACLAIAGKVDAARQVLLGMSGRARDAAVSAVFDAAHPVADAGDDESAGPIMELVVEFQPDRYMARYHAGMAAAIAGDDAGARGHLTRFLELYRSQDGWTQNAQNALEALGRPRAQRTVKRGSEGSFVFWVF